VKGGPVKAAQRPRVDRGRRTALQSGGLAVAFLWLAQPGKAGAMMSARPQSGDVAAAASDGAPAFAPNAFIRIGADGTIRLVMPNVEMGQAIYTGSCMLLAEELDVGMDQIHVEHSPPDDALYGNPLIGGQITGGSTSTRGTWVVLREAAALARALLVAAAAKEWRVDVQSCTTERAMVRHRASGRSASYGRLATAAAAMALPANVKLKGPAQFKLIGRPLRRVDAADKVKGATQFGIDVRVPGMKIATVRASPTLGGTLAALDDREARTIPGVVDVLRIGNAVAVVADNFWAAKLGLEALRIDWAPGANADLSTQRLGAAFAASLASGKAIVGRETGSRPAGKSIVATYRSPMLAHATMEPLNTTVHVTPDCCEIWVGTQVPARAVAVAARITGLAQDKVLLHNQYLGGGFGRRLETDSVEQAVAFARQVPYPLKVVWTREEDIRQDIVRPPYLDQVSAVVDRAGKPLWFGDRIVGPTLLDRFAPPFLRKDGMDSDVIECAAETPYAFANAKVEWVRHDMPKGLLTGWWRGVGATHNLFVVESFIDELAHAAGTDPVAYRRALLGANPRSLAVLELAAHQFGWGRPLPRGVGQGVAIGEPFGSRVCAMVEVEVTPAGDVRLRRAVISVDCGLVINVSSFEAQMEGGLIFGLSAALFNGITLKGGAIEQSNFHDYRTLRIDEIPVIEVHRVQNDEAPGGLGEVGTAIAAPALTNAIFSASGVRLRELPVDRSRLVREGQGPKGASALAHAEGNTT
jgi:isoquinoline 1-oxidoreductase beta subunit